MWCWCGPAARACGAANGSFTIINAVIAANGYVQTFDATFEQRCDGFAGTARGEVHIANPPPPPALEAGLTVDATGEVSAGLATLHGNVTCTKPTTVGLGTSVTQKVKGTQVNGGVFVIVDCTPGAPVPWTGEAQALGPVGFRQGDLDVQIQGTAIDFDYDQVIVLDATTVVRLRKVRA